jgi:hypothetical protein
MPLCCQKSTKPQHYTLALPFYCAPYNEFALPIKIAKQLLIKFFTILTNAFISIKKLGEATSSGLLLMVLDKIDFLVLN